MPFSSSAFDYYISTMIGLLRPSTVCDIGPGEGKYSYIVHERAKLDEFNCHLTAVEIDRCYVDMTTCTLYITKSLLQTRLIL